MKKLCLCLTILAALLFFAGCGGSKKENKNETPDSEESVTDDDAVDTEPSGDTEPTDTEPADDSDTEPTEPTEEPGICNPNPCKNIANSDGICTAHQNDFSCGCNKHYFWDGEECMEWCALGYCKEEYMEGSTGKCYYDDTQDESPYLCECKEHYLWDNAYQYCDNETKIGQCTGLPENAEWNTVSEITQPWDAGNEELQGVYNEEPSSYECRFKCKETYFWNGKNCIDPCADNPCAAFEHAINHSCESKSAFEYLCDCEYEYYWNGKIAGCVDRRPSLGIICTDDDKCHAFPSPKAAECPAKGETFYGQDAQYANAGTCVRQYFESDDDTITSLTTGLSWQKEIPETTYTFEAAKEYCEQLDLAGKNDWRIPNIHELMTLFTNGSTRSTYFQNLYSKVFWTSAAGSSSATVLSFEYSSAPETYSYSKSNPYSVICVRGDELPSLELTEWTVNSTKVYVDSSSELMWQKEAAPYKNPRQAFKYCENLVHAGYSDWRLPNTNEISAFIIASINSTINHDGSNWMRFISSSYFSSVYAVNLQRSNADQDSYHTVRCVRSDICKEGFFWEGEKCAADPCKTANCGTNSTGFCIPQTEEKYECLCNNNYFWNGNACSYCGGGTCSQVYNSNGSCTASDAENYYCNCNSGYKWDGEQCVESESANTQSNTLNKICTDQEKCYSNNTEITCPAEGEDFFGQDAQFSHGCFSKTFSQGLANNQKYIIDDNNGLEWTQTLSEGFYTWVGANVYCENLDYAGKKDWRLPNMHEMQTIDMKNQLFKTVFESVTEAKVWTSSAYQDDTAAWTFNPISYKSQKNDSFRVMCVRGKRMSQKSFTISGSATEEYATFVPARAGDPKWTKTIAKEKTWQEALSYCENLTYAGISNWHLPDINELLSLVNYEKTEPASNFPEMPANTKLWSSTSKESYAAIAYSLDFERGTVDSSYTKSAKKSVVCISYQ